MRAGEPHAEVHALRQAGARARGATAYVTLEPCSHHGRTPPCAEALVEAGVARVVAAMQDPNPQVAGRGLQRLRAAGIAVTCGVLEAEARALNVGFVKRMEQGLPYVRVKLAMSLDGRTAMANGESQWITGPQARAAVQRLRARSSVVITGADTVLCRQRPPHRAPRRAGGRRRADGAGRRAPAAARAGRRPAARTADAAFFQAGPAHGGLLRGRRARRPTTRQAAMCCCPCPRGDGHVDLRLLLAELAAAGANEVLVEAGPRLAGAFAREGLVDEYRIFMAPQLLGSTARPLLDWPLAQMSEAPQLDIREIRAVGRDWQIVARPV